MEANNFSSALMERTDQVAIGAGQEAVGQFDDGHLRAQFGVDGSHFQADVTAADNQQRFGNVGQLKRAGGIHHARSGQIEHGNSDGREPVARMQWS